MGLGIFLTIAAIIGILYGIFNKSKILIIASVILLIFVIVVGVYFYNNPY